MSGKYSSQIQLWLTSIFIYHDIKKFLYPRLKEFTSGRLFFPQNFFCLMVSVSVWMVSDGVSECLDGQNFLTQIL